MSDVTLTWNTALLYPDPSSTELENDLSSFEPMAAEFRSRYLEQMATLEPSAILEALREYERMQTRMAKPFYYAHLLFAQDSTSDTNRALSQRCSELGSRLSQQLLFFDLELMNLPNELFARLCALPEAAPFVHFLKSNRKFREYTLKENEERLLTRKDLTGSRALTKLYDELSASLSYRMLYDGEEKEFTGEELLGLLHDPSAEVRYNAQTCFLEKHAEGAHALVFNTVFNTMALDHAQEMELRGYGSAIQPTNIGNELTDEAVEHLLQVTENNYGLARDYFRLKAGMLGVERLRNCDIYAPVAETAITFPFDEARDLSVAAYRAYDPQFGDMVQAFFDERRVDVMPRPGKSGGAFAMGISPVDPTFLLLNYTGNLRDIATIAHEAGHGLHFELSKKQNSLNYHAPLPLAETASVFGEMLFTRLMLDREQDTSLRRSLLCAKIEDIIATTFRQTVLTRFELRLHLERKQGLLSNEQICAIWLEENGKLFGDAVEMIPAYQWGWTYISHFIHSRFYCYSYTFAELLVLALYQQYREQGEAFKPGYKALLEAGGSLSPADAASLVGIDIEDSGFWQKGYDFLAGLIDELKQLEN